MPLLVPVPVPLGRGEGSERDGVRRSGACGFGPGEGYRDEGEMVRASWPELPPGFGLILGKVPLADDVGEPYCGCSDDCMCCKCGGRRCCN